MKNISTINTNDKRGLTDLEWINEFYLYLKGEKLPEEAGIPNQSGLDLTEEKAFTIIWFLQEHLGILPNNIEQCCICKELYDSSSEGYYYEKGTEEGHFFCDSHLNEIPYE